MKITIQLFDLSGVVHSSSNINHKIDPWTIKDTPEFLQDVIKDIDLVVSVYGFRPYYNEMQFDKSEVSHRNDGWAAYLPYVWLGEDGVIKLIIDVRIADHRSGDVVEKRKTMIKNMKRKYPEITYEAVDTNTLDTYCKQTNTGTAIFIERKHGGYTESIEDFNQMDRIIEGKLDDITAPYR